MGLKSSKAYVKLRDKYYYYKNKDYLTVRKNKKGINSSKGLISGYKNKYKDTRCFIIGNGPSLTVEDLEKLKNEMTFASHGIYYIYDKTDWRPTFYCAQDSLLINERYNDIKSKCLDSVRFFGVVNNREYPDFKSDDILIELLNKPFTDGYPDFSQDALRGFYEGLTVTYFNIQLAVYMGFKEIYLLGVDHFYSGDTENEHFCALDKCTVRPQTDKTTYSYMKAKTFCDGHSIKIMNATRGGHLEVFDRVDYDKLFKEK